MSVTTEFAKVEQAYIQWFSNHAASQKSLARELNLSHSIVHNIANGKHKYSPDLKAKYPGLERTAPPALKPGRPARIVVADTVADVDVEPEPEIDLALKALEVLPDLCPASSVLFAKAAFPEFAELLRMISKPLCPRLSKYLTHPGRPVKSQRTDEATRLVVEEEIQEGERLTEEFLKDK
jgi:hypothetical protein